jgi:hypothetical protein
VPPSLACNSRRGVCQSPPGCCARKLPPACGELAAKRLRLDEVDEGPLAVDLEHRQPLPVAPFELRVAGDVDLRELDAFGEERGARTLAEVAPRGGVEDELGYG